MPAKRCVNAKQNAKYFSNLKVTHVTLIFWKGVFLKISITSVTMLFYTFLLKNQLFQTLIQILQEKNQ